MIRSLIACCLIIGALIFTVLNPHPVAVSILPGSTSMYPLRIVSLIFLAIGMAAVSIFIMPVMLRLSFQLRRVKKELSGFEAAAETDEHEEDENDETKIEDTGCKIQETG